MRKEVKKAQQILNIKINAKKYPKINKNIMQIKNLPLGIY